MVLSSNKSCSNAELIFIWEEIINQGLKYINDNCNCKRGNERNTRFYYLVLLKFGLLLVSRGLYTGKLISKPDRNVNDDIPAPAIIALPTGTSMIVL